MIDVVIQVSSEAIGLTADMSVKSGIKAASHDIQT
jgi:hypothetical protein